VFKPTAELSFRINRTLPPRRLNTALGVVMELVRNFTIFADYFQFVVMDETSEDDFSEIWSEAGLNRMLAVGRSAVCPGTLRNIDVDVEVHVLDQAPDISLAEFDHAAEASLSVPSGSLVVMGCTGYLPDAPRIEVAPGCYQMLFLVTGVSTITNEWEPAHDKYIVFLWPGSSREAKLLKHWRADAQLCVQADRGERL